MMDSINGIGYASLTVTELTWRASKQSRDFPFDFVTTVTGELHALWLSSITPSSNIRSTSANIFRSTAGETELYRCLVGLQFLRRWRVWWVWFFQDLPLRWMEIARSPEVCSFAPGQAGAYLVNLLRLRRALSQVELFLLGWVIVWMTARNQSRDTAHFVMKELCIIWFC